MNNQLVSSELYVIVAAPPLLNPTSYCISDVEVSLEDFYQVGFELKIIRPLGESAIISFEYSVFRLCQLDLWDVNLFLSKLCFGPKDVFLKLIQL